MYYLHVELNASIISDGLSSYREVMNPFRTKLKQSGYKRSTICTNRNTKMCLYISWSVEVKMPFIVTGKMKRTRLFEGLFEGTLNPIRQFFFYQIIGLCGIQS